MSLRSPIIKTIARAALLGAIASTAGAAMAADPAHVRGTIVSATADMLTVKTSDGTVSLSFDASTKIAGIVPSSADKIKAGTFVGIANVPGHGTSSALEVVVFPDAMKGSGLGDYPWDLAGAKTGGATRSSAMTNGTVKSSTASSGMVTQSAMTNGTVKAASTQGALSLTVDYGQGEKTIQVPNGVPVVGIEAADATKLVAGAHVFVATKKDAPKSAGFIAVGIGGTVPPM